ncbi:zinc-dependent alcohol dehydrogenase family protein [Variovorax ginsengisoli]|uniref:Zinc-dependent alcohol dehydrogenase family protein n=1 Tax=Variovorax ginsengisoli TaxID=363844 RepID=A0ABT8RW45_9BURK|nr:zinc-dependent alcohol dehydrogenase family protein [Variovorax ginsengisoli]MDN8611648.1 zinc-dependent alcohol dehydrogenase family protein [Variovorax ginsengisoli]MDO1530818.1 zinc-dependent alcohol dehydrogenase family protein [Variovorax ginsengisoli]
MSMTNTMKAVQLQVTGGPEVLSLVELPLPVPGPGQVRVKAEAVGAGGPDVLIRNGTYKWMPPLPAIPGNELAGVVDAVGPGASRLAVGERVLVSARELPQRGGCYAEYICVPEAVPFVLPASVSFDAAVSLGNFQLAIALLASNGNLPAQAVLVPGAAGGVATTLAQVARARGLRVIGTASSDEKRAFALDNGVSDIVDGDPRTLPERVLALTGGRGVDLAFDHVGGALFVACLRSLAPFGMAVSYNILAGPPSSDVFDELRRLLGRSLAIRTFSIHTVDADVAQRRGLMAQAIALMASGQVRAPRATRMPLAQARRAHELLDNGGSLGKLVLVP